MKYHYIPIVTEGETQRGRATAPSHAAVSDRAWIRRRSVTLRGLGFDSIYLLIFIRTRVRVGGRQASLPLEVTLCNPSSPPEGATGPERPHVPSLPLGGGGEQTKAQPQTQPLGSKATY